MQPTLEVTNSCCHKSKAVRTEKLYVLTTFFNETLNVWPWTRGEHWLDQPWITRIG